MCQLMGDGKVHTPDKFRIVVEPLIYQNGLAVQEEIQRLHVVIIDGSPERIIGGLTQNASIRSNIDELDLKSQHSCQFKHIYPVAHPLFRNMGFFISALEVVQPGFLAWRIAFDAKTAQS